LINQKKGLNTGITELGRHVLRELLGRHNGKRIYIDTKHMSVQSRKEYFGFVRNYNVINPNDKIPVLSSHTGANGYKDLDSSLKIFDHNRKSRKTYLNKRSLNISHEEIRVIHESEGILGIMLDKGNLGGGLKIKELTEMKPGQKKTDGFSKLIWSNIFEVTKAVKDKSAWDIVGLGTDYDGGISHVDNYLNAESLTKLKYDLTSYLDKTNFHKEMWYGYTPEELTDKIFRINSMNFYKKHFR